MDAKQIVFEILAAQSAPVSLSWLTDEIIRRGYGNILVGDLIEAIAEYKSIGA